MKLQAAACRLELFGEQISDPVPLTRLKIGWVMGGSC